VLALIPACRGFPILNGSESRLDLHSSFSFDTNDHEAAVDRTVWGSFHAPGSHTDEALVDRVWFHEPIASDDGTHTIVLHSKGASKTGGPIGLFFRYDVKQLPELTTWSHMVAGEYICGIEPCEQDTTVLCPPCAPSVCTGQCHVVLTAS
jgi:hypothetical protein